MTKNLESRQVTLSPGGKQFSTQPNTSILESGLSSGVALPFSCANGSCGDCRAKILTGTVSKIQFHDFALTEAEKLSGICLLCANAAETDLVIEASEAYSVQDIPTQHLRGKLCFQMNQSDVSILRFKIARGKALRFLSGQYAQVTTQNGHRVSLPIANCPCDPDYLEFHIPLSPIHQSDAGHALTELSSRERIDIKGPHGNFTLTNLEQSNCSSLVFIAIGSGFAAIKPVLEHVISLEEHTPCQLIWIATESVPHYMNNLCRSWNDAFDSFDYLPLDTMAAFNVDRLITQKSDNTHEATRIYISGDELNSQLIKRRLTTAGIAPETIAVDSTAISSLHDYSLP